MATTTTTTTRRRPRRSPRLIADDMFKPNVRPHGIELVPDTKWRDWRLREASGGLKEKYPEMWPPITPALHALAVDELARQRASDPQRQRGFQPRSLADLDAYRATQLQFRSMREISRRVEETRRATRPPTEEFREVDYDNLPPFFYEELSSDLFARVWEFANDTFGHKDWADLVHERDWTSHWLSRLPDAFVNSAARVARGDPLRGAKPGSDEHGYEFLFLEQHNRVYLCTAVIAKLLEENCFDSLLFGATAAQKKTLKLMDESTDDIDGMRPPKPDT